MILLRWNVMWGSWLVAFWIVRRGVVKRPGFLDASDAKIDDLRDWTVCQVPRKGWRTNESIPACMLDLQKITLLWKRRKLCIDIVQNKILIVYEPRALLGCVRLIADRTILELIRKPFAHSAIWEMKYLEQLYLFVVFGKMSKRR